MVTLGNGKGKTLLLRGDMDALPMAENTDLPFKSTNGYAHTCGHDIHTTFMLGAAKLLKAKESEINGTVLVIGRMGGGKVANIIPDTAHLDATLRSFNPKVRVHLFNRVQEIMDATVKMMRGTYKLKTISTPSLYNNVDLCEQMAPYVKEVLCESNLRVDKEPLFGTEDFSYISQAVPTMFMFAGANGLGEHNYPLHNPNIVLDEGVIPLGVAVVVHCAISWLNDYSGN
ncbi:M20 family metallopeptidase [Ammoniphilus sp. 3BR4]|uniref:M20 metallopeptidase family protein n=1 Tax=Ammoniphilus sp. 3BR4 TaxID=3158265 RepID=UPI003465547F